MTEEEYKMWKVFYGQNTPMEMSKALWRLSSDYAKWDFEDSPVQHLSYVLEGFFEDAKDNNGAQLIFEVLHDIVTRIKKHKIAG